MINTPRAGSVKRAQSPERRSVRIARRDETKVIENNSCESVGLHGDTDTVGIRTDKQRRKLLGEREGNKICVCGACVCVMECSYVVHPATDGTGMDWRWGP